MLEPKENYLFGCCIEAQVDTQREHFALRYHPVGQPNGDVSALVGKWNESALSFPVQLLNNDPETTAHIFEALRCVFANGSKIADSEAADTLWNQLQTNVINSSCNPGNVLWQWNNPTGESFERQLDQFVSQLTTPETYSNWAFTDSIDVSEPYLNLFCKQDDSSYSLVARVGYWQMMEGVFPVELLPNQSQSHRQAVVDALDFYVNELPEQKHQTADRDFKAIWKYLQYQCMSAATHYSDVLWRSGT